MRNIPSILAGLIVLGALVFIGLIVRTIQKGSRRDRAVLALLKPVLDAINDGRDPDAAHLARFADNPLTRGRLYDILEQKGRTDLFPERHYNAASFAESDLVYWLAHPNELGQAPDKIELMGTVKRTSGSKVGEYYVFRYRTEPPHWAAGKFWLAGIAGPHLTGESLSTMCSGTFSRLEEFDSQTLDEHVTACLDATTQSLMVARSP
jgi:hypothetical protein